MSVDPDVNYAEISKCADDFNGAQCKAICVEAGMIALRRGGDVIQHEDFHEAVTEVQSKKKGQLLYYA